MKGVQINIVIQARPDERTHLSNTEIRSSNINEVSYVSNEKNRSPDKKKDKPPPPSQNPTNLHKSKTSVFIVGDSIINSSMTEAVII